MDDMETVHEAKEDRRKARGVRMAKSLWDFVDSQADALGESGASQLIERWVREKLDAVRKVA